MSEDSANWEFEDPLSDEVVESVRDIADAAAPDGFVRIGRRKANGAELSSYVRAVDWKRSEAAEDLCESLEGEQFAILSAHGQARLEVLVRDGAVRGQRFELKAEINAAREEAILVFSITGMGPTMEAATRTAGADLVRAAWKGAPVPRDAGQMQEAWRRAERIVELGAQFLGQRHKVYVAYVKSSGESGPVVANHAWTVDLIRAAGPSYRARWKSVSTAVERMEPKSGEWVNAGRTHMHLAANGYVVLMAEEFYFIRDELQWVVLGSIRNGAEIRVEGLPYHEITDYSTRDKPVNVVQLEDVRRQRSQEDAGVTP